MEDRGYIPYGRQWIDENDIDAVVRVLKSDYLTTGPVVEQFEKKLADFVGARFAVALSSGTAALHAACFAAGIKEGDEVITSPMTFAASANCILYNGGRPVFADIDPVTYNISADEIEKRITDATKAIIPVHYTGQPCDMDAIMRIAGKHGLTVIEDGCHALAAKYKGRRVGSMGDMTVFSFHPVKHITTGEGGAVTTDDAELYEKLKMFRIHGMTRDNERLTRDEGPWYYEQQFLGYNYRMTDIQAALGVSQLDKLDMFTARRKKLAQVYGRELRNVADVITPIQLDGAVSSWHLYVIRLSDEAVPARRSVYEQLRARGIGVNVHYIPVYLHPYYRDMGYPEGLCPQAEKHYAGIITLPLHPAMSEDDVKYIASNAADVVSANKRRVLYESTGYRRSRFHRPVGSERTVG